MLRAHKIELRPTEAQARYLARCAGTMRFVYNQLVAKAKSEKYNRKAFQKFCSTLRKETPWMNEVACRATYEAADNFHKSISNFFKSCQGKNSGRKFKFPAFKKKSGKQSFQFSHTEQFSVKGLKLRIQGLKKQHIWMRECIRFHGTVKAVTIKFHGGKWFAIFAVELPEIVQPPQGATRESRVGVDFGLKSFAVLSNGETVANPRPLRRKLGLLRRRQKQLSRKLAGSGRRAVAKARVARIHRKVVDQRSAFQHSFVNSLVTRFDEIVIEDLNVEGMRKNRKLAMAINDVGWSAVRGILNYKCETSGVKLVVADRFFPSSKTCSYCGSVKQKLELKERTYNCEVCGFSSDRDFNAAINLVNHQPSPPIMGRRKTDVEGLSKSSEQSGAGLFDCVNNVNLQPRNSVEAQETGYMAAF